MATTPIFDPQGNLRDIPDDQVDAALSAGGKRAVQMTDPNGVTRHIQEDQQDAALKAGGKLYQGPGVLKRFAQRYAQGVGLPSSAADVQSQVPTTAAGAVQSMAESLPGAQGVTAAINYGKNLYQRGKEALGEAHDEVDNIRKGQPILPNLGKDAYAGTNLIMRGVLGPVGGDALMNAGEDAAQHGVLSPEYAGSAAASLTAAALAKGAKEAPDAPGALKKVARNIVSAGDQDVLDAATKISTKAANEAADTRIRNQAADEDARRSFGKTDEANAAALKKHAADVQQTIADNAAIAQKHAQDTAAVNQENAARLDAFNRQPQVASQINDRAADLDRRVQQAGVNAKAENDTNWNEWRKAVAGTKADTEGIVGTIKAQSDKLVKPEARAEFKQIIAGATPDKDELSGPEAARQGIIDDNQLAPKGTPYEALSPQLQSTVDRVMKEAGLGDIADDVEDEKGTPKTKQVPATLLHGWKTYLESAVRSDSVDGNVKTAIGQVLDAVRGEEENVSKTAGPEAQAALETARATHGPYVDTFRNSPNEAPTVASDFLKKTTPDFQAQKKLADYTAKLSKYDPQIGVQAAHIAQLQQQAEALNKVAPMTKGETPLPPPPTFKPMPEAPGTTPYVTSHKNVNLPIEKPEISSEAIRESLIKKTAARWRQTSQYQIRRLAASGIAGVIAPLLGHSGLEGAALGYTAAEFFPKIAANIVERPKVLKWLAEPSLGDINALKTIPHADQVFIADTIAGVAVKEAQAGRPVTVGKDAVHFLGPARLAAIHNANLPKTAAEAKKRIKDSQEK